MVSVYNAMTWRDRTLCKVPMLSVGGDNQYWVTTACCTSRAKDIEIVFPVISSVRAQVHSIEYKIKRAEEREKNHYLLHRTVVDRRVAV